MISASGRADIGTAVAVLKFSSRGCDNVRVLPVSILFQETVLLSRFQSPEDDRLFVYRNQVWKDVAQDQMALSHLSQRFLQMLRLRPDPAIDTMLYIVSPKKCGPRGIDWSQFWSI